MKPLVSIICITFNQEQFIRQTLEGFLMQETNFPFEVLVHDDASSDKTPAIIKELRSKNPDIIKPIIEKENQYSNSGWSFLNDMFYSAEGKYIALCEGDDFWTDPRKLQKQFDFLESHPDYSLCFHPVTIHFENDSIKDRVSPLIEKKKTFTIEALLRDNYIHTCSVMYRKQPYNNLPDAIMPHDVYMHLLHAKQGRIGFINDVMGTYRKQSEGVWWESGSHMERIYLKHRYMLTNLFAELLKLFKTEPRYRGIIYKHLDHLLSAFISIDKTKKTMLFAETAKDFPELVTRYAMQQQEYIDELEAERSRLKRLSDDHASELRDIKNSKWYRLHPKRIAQYVRSDKSKK